MPAALSATTTPALPPEPLTGPHPISDALVARAQWSALPGDQRRVLLYAELHAQRDGVWVFGVARCARVLSVPEDRVLDALNELAAARRITFVLLWPRARQRVGVSGVYAAVALRFGSGRGMDIPVGKSLRQMALELEARHRRGEGPQ